MRKAEREIKDFNEIVALLGRCDTLHIGMTGENGPYVVPVSFGFEVGNGQIDASMICSQRIGASAWKRV